MFLYWQAFLFIWNILISEQHNWSKGNLFQWYLGPVPFDDHENEDRDLELNSVLIGGATGKNSLICVA